MPLPTANPAPLQQVSQAGAVLWGHTEVSAGTVVAHMHGRLTPRQLDMGRTLRRRLVAAQLTDVTAAPVTCFFSDPASAAVVLPMVNPMVPAEAWMTPPGVREEWLAHVDAAGERGDFLAILTIWVVAGTVADL